MRRIVILIAASLFASFLFLACGGGGSSGGGTGNLQGTWLGWIEDDEGTIEEFSLEIGGSGNVIDAQIGGYSYGTGHIYDDWDENLFHVHDYEGDALGHGIMIVDNEYSHATYGNNISFSSNFYLGVLQKGATNLPAHALSDIVASYSVGGAYLFTQDSHGTWNWEGEDISMTVDQDLTFIGSASGEPFSGSFDASLFDTTHGRYAGTLTHNTATMDIAAFLSPDETAVAAFATTYSNPTSLENFILIGLKK